MAFLKYIFGAIFIALAWAVALVYPALHLTWLAIVVTVVVVLGLVTWHAIKILTAKRAAARIESALQAEAREQAGRARPDLAPEIQAMTAEFERAVASLKSSRVGRSGRDALGVLPWYVIIGPPGAGKTTALQNSGLKFPATRKARVRGVGGTRNCDWFLSNEAIILDTAGRWMTEDEDRDEWLAFLDLLKRTRPKKPVNGMMVAVSITDLQGSEEETAELGRRLRERIDEVMGRLEMVVPVYLLVTKCDLIPGFVETFGELRDKERGQLWGFTLPIDASQEERLDLARQHVRDLSDVVEARAWKSLREERRLEARQPIYEFPQQFTSLVGSLDELLATLFADNVYVDAPVMRGVYFTSGTQEGRPIDRIMGNLAEAFGVRPQAVVAQPVLKPKSYFVRELFYRVIFPDQDIAMRSSRVLRRQRLVRVGMTVAALGLSVGFLVLPLSSYFENRKLLDESEQHLDRLAKLHSARGGRAPLATEMLEMTEPMNERLAKFVTKGPDVSLRFGLYPGEDLLEPLRVAIENDLIRPLLEADAETMAALAHGTASGQGASDALTLHLLLTQPKAADEPSPDEDGWREKWQPLTIELAQQRWAALAGPAATTKARHSIETALRFYLEPLEDPDQLLDRKAALVGRVRAALIGTNAGDPLEELIGGPGMPADVRLVDLVGGAITAFKGVDAADGGPRIPGAFTPRGWRVVTQRLDRREKDAESDEMSWVLGQRRTVADVKRDALEAAYFRRYVDVWKSFLIGIAIKEPSTVDEGRALLRAITMERPLDALWRNSAVDLSPPKNESLLDDVKKSALKRAGDQGQRAVNAANTARRRLGEDDEDRPADRGPEQPEDVQREFATFLEFGLKKPSGLETYTQILNEVLGSLGETGMPEAKGFQTALRTQKTKLGSLILSYNEHKWEAGLLEKLLMPPLRGLETAIAGATGDNANRKWCESVVTTFGQLLGDRYPFSSSRKAKDARAADIERFFQPKTGVLWQYYSDNLASDIDRANGTSVFRIKDEAAVKWKPNLAAFLKRAQEITDVLFAKDPSKLGVNAWVRLRGSPPFAKVELVAGERKVTYFNAKERWEPFAWPANGAFFYLYDKNGKQTLGPEEGELAFLHLLDAGKITLVSEGEDYLSGSWETALGDAHVNADFRPAALNHLFRGFSVPESVVAGAGGCGR